MRPIGWNDWDGFTQGEFLVRQRDRGFALTELSGKYNIAYASLRGLIRLAEVPPEIRQLCLDLKLPISVIKILITLPDELCKAMIRRAGAEKWGCVRAREERKRLEKDAAQAFAEGCYMNGEGELLSSSYQHKQRMKEIEKQLMVECSRLPSRIL